jgi:hypothetical protein
VIVVVKITTKECTVFLMNQDLTLAAKVRQTVQALVQSIFLENVQM